MMSKADEIEKLALLRDKGILTEEEFQAEKKRVLDGTDVIAKSRYRDDDEMEKIVKHSSKAGKKTAKTSFKQNNPNQSSGKPKNIFTRYVDCIKKYAVFKGRASRAEYWSCFLINFIISAIILPQKSFISVLYSLFICLPFLAVNVRRLHDTGHSGGLLFFPPIISFVVTFIVVFSGVTRSGFNEMMPVFFLFIAVCLPFIFSVYLIFLLAKKGDAFTNSYGDIPE